MGVKRPKKITPNTIGLTIIPSNHPNLIHNLLKGRSASGLKIEAKKHNIASNNKHKNVSPKVFIPK